MLVEVQAVSGKNIGLLTPISLWLFVITTCAQASFIGDMLYDFADIPVNLVSKETLCAGAFFVPAFFWGSDCDEPIHNRYFCRRHRKNVYNYPNWWHEASDKSAMIVDLGVSTILMLWPDSEKRTMGHVFFVGSIYTMVVKDLLKKIHWDHNLRPENSCFDTSSRHYGGYPSGHMALSLYMATFFGKVGGPLWSLPFGLWAGFILVDSLRCNRHYLSQLLSGGCLGVIFGFAAAKTFFEYKNNDFSCHVGVNPDGRLALQASCEF